MATVTKLLSHGLKALTQRGNGPNPLLHYSSSSTTMKVTILGAAGNTGKSMSLMLKQSPFIDELCLYDTQSLEGFTNDLNYVDTKCRVTSYFGNKDIHKALTKSNIIVILSCFRHTTEAQNYANLFDRNAPIVKDLATRIAKFAPKSTVAIGVEPINSMVPMFSEIMKKYGHYNPYTIFGITTVDVVRTNKFVAEILGLEPECVMVPVVGGHSEKTIVPVLSKATPCNDLTNEELEDVTISVRKANENLHKVRSDGAYLCNAFSISRFVISLVKAARGQNDVVECTYVKSNVHPQLKYMVSPVLLGPGGVAKNLGLPELSDYETCLLENAIPILAEEIKKGEYVGGRPMDLIDGVLHEKPLCDPCKEPRCPPDHCELQSLFADK
ncbi:malate dehydrogenase, mitochondrial-like [Tribolium madens]|uniref:malate dehydrogenase, mitochondrial-like n=1 Tax=Tribolium madens TaxID=41895 RepID=UPI001CF720C3|nr:malate dehydrogenase, mitochondrial-like [Tribolium madens]